MEHVFSGTWINPELEPSVLPERVPDRWRGRRASYLKKEFSAAKGGKAELYITAHGLYEAFLNGRRVGDAVLMPGPAQYGSVMPCQVYDVSALMADGPNRIEVTLGNGWYRGCNGNNNTMELFGSDTALLAELRIDRKSVLHTDADWLAHQEGPIGENDLKQGETFDAGRSGRSRAWHAVREESFGMEGLVLSDEPPILEHERLSGRLITTPDGRKVVDFGQNLTGYVEMRFTASAGQTVTLTHGETLDENGNFTIANFQTPTKQFPLSALQEIRYTAKEGANCYKPSFAVFGFRYVLVEGDIDPEDMEFTAIAVYSDMKRTGFFSCSDERVNRLVENTVWSMKGNFLGVPTDCPTRERAGWTGDAQAFVSTGLYLMDCAPVFRKWLRDLRANQYDNGKIRGIAPDVEPARGLHRMMDGAAGWGDACVIVPYTIWQRTGDMQILRENYSMMKKWMAFSVRRARKSKLKNRFRKNPYKNYTVDTGFHWGEWLEPGQDSVRYMRDNVKNGVPEVATAYLSYSASLMAEIAGVLGETADSESFRALAENAKKAYQLLQMDENGVPRKTSRQCEYVRPLAFGLAGNAEKTAEALNRLIRENDYHLNTGFLSTPYLCGMLTKYGYHDTACRLLLQESVPSWLYAVENGATTIWETWDGRRADGTVHDSFNHYSYGAVVGWLFADVAGIRVEGERIRIAPCPDAQLSFAGAQYGSPLGRIGSRWEIRGGEVLYTVTIPAGRTAELCLPGAETMSVGAGTHTFTGELARVSLGVSPISLL